MLGFDTFSHSPNMPAESAEETGDAGTTRVDEFGNRWKDGWTEETVEDPLAKLLAEAAAEKTAQRDFSPPQEMFEAGHDSMTLVFARPTDAEIARRNRPPAH